MTSASRLGYLLDQRIHLLLPILQITTLHKMLQLPRPESTRRFRELEWPQEVARLLEVRSHRTISCTSTRDTLLVDPSSSALVDEVVDSF